jgi:fructose-1-phosphate kinase PfkB-like protein
LLTEANLLDAIQELRQAGAQWVAITDGGRPLLASGRSAPESREQMLRLTPPQVDAVNPIGAGDCLTAGTAWGIVQGKDVPTALALGVAAAVENVRQLLPARLNPDSVRQLAATLMRQDV